MSMEIAALAAAGPGGGAGALHGGGALASAGAAGGAGGAGRTGGRRRHHIERRFGQSEAAFSGRRYLTEETGRRARRGIGIDGLDERFAGAARHKPALQPATRLRQASNHGALLLVEKEFSVLGRAEVVIGELLKERKLLAALSATHRVKSLMRIIGTTATKWYEY
jgi:hypothetical protein